MASLATDICLFNITGSGYVHLRFCIMLNLMYFALAIVSKKKKNPPLSNIWNSA